MHDIFSTEERIKILQAILFKEDPVSVNNIAYQLKLSKGLVSKYFDILTKKGILKRLKGKLCVKDSPLTGGIMILLNIRNINIRLFKKYPFVVSAGLFGSCAKGENTEDSDVDIWIKIKDERETKLASLTTEVNKKIKNAKILFLTDKKTMKIKEEDEMFYHSLVFGSIILYGDKSGVQL